MQSLPSGISFKIIHANGRVHIPRCNPESVDPIQHTINSIETTKSEVFLGMGNYNVLRLNNNMELAGIIPIGWEIKRVKVDGDNLFVTSLKEVVHWHCLSTKDTAEYRIPYGSLGLHITAEKDIVAGAYQGLVRVWDSNGQLKYDLEGHDTRVWAIAEYDGMIITGDGFRGPNSFIRFWSKDDGTIISIIRRENHRVNSILVNGDELLATMGRPGEIVSYNISDQTVNWGVQIGANLTEIALGEDVIYASDNNKLIELSRDGEVKSRTQFEGSIIAMNNWKNGFLLGVDNTLHYLNSSLEEVERISIDKEFTLSRQPVT